MKLAWREVLAAWRDDHAFRQLFSASLADLPFEDFYWETPPLAAATLDTQFACAVSDARGALEVPADCRSFAQHLEAGRGTAEVRRFANLGGDAVLIAPCECAPPQTYAHLARFLREAPAAQLHALWREVAGAATERLEDAPLWVSTAGGGVAWLHVRLDTRPKYYVHAPYRDSV